MKPITLFFDGTCGLCHEFIRFVAFRMKDNSPFQFCPQDTIDSVIVEYQGKVLHKTEAIILILSHLSWPWTLLAFCLRLIPLTIANWGYDQVSKIRHKISKKPQTICPLLPAKLQKYFITKQALPILNLKSKSQLKNKK